MGIEKMASEGQKLWGGRFTKASSEILWKYNASIELDKRLWKEDIQGSCVYARGLEKAGYLSQDELRRIMDGLDRISNEWTTDTFSVLPTDEDIHTANERRLCELIGHEVGGKLHTARSRNDQVQTDVHLWLRNGTKIIQRKILNILSTIADHASQHIALLMPSYTHLQPAQIIRYSHWILNHGVSLRQCWTRFQNIDSIHWCPLGSGAIAGNALGIDRDYLADLLGFRNGPTLSSSQCTGNRDGVLDFLYACCATFIALSKMAEDMITFCSPQFSFIKLDQAFCTGSSLMPQKQNPDALELIRGKSSTTVGRLSGFLTTLKGLPSGYNKDLQEDKLQLFSTFDDLTAALTLIEEIVATTSPNEEQLNRSLSPMMLSTDIAYYLVRKGVPFRHAHSLAGQVVSLSEELRLPLNELPLDRCQEISTHFDESLFICLNSFEASVEQYTSTGGTSKSAVLTTIQNLKDLVAKNLLD